MPEKPLAELREMVGESHSVVEDLEIEAGKVEEFARSVHDDDPVHRDADAAAESGFDAIPAPLTFTRVGFFPRYRPDDVDDMRPYDLGFDPGRKVHGEQEYTYERPLVVGDVLSGEITLTDVYQRESSGGGTLTFAEFVIEYTDEDDATVLTERVTVIETPEEGESDE